MSYDDSFFDDDIDIAAFDATVSAAATTTKITSPGQPSRFATSQTRYKQQTIFGASQVPEKSKRQNKTSNSLQNGSSIAFDPMKNSSANSQLAPKVKSVKKWDRIKAIRSLPKALEAASHQKDEDEDEVLNDDGEGDSDNDLLIQAMRESEDAIANAPMKLQVDHEAVKTWVYSINKPKRKYQYDIVAKALFNNCLVSLPTGLGKTFIAAVVMLNFYRWYPKGKVIFLAPTRPLVQQQIEACHSIAGIPSSDCVSMTGTTPASKRAIAWDQKRVIFATPQTVANDLRRGNLRPEDVICLVVDEAHRSSGAYAYCVVVRLLMRFNPHFRVLALTATPGSDPARVQGVIDNLHIGHIEVRTEESMDIKPYTKNKQIFLEKISLTPELIMIRDKWAELMLPLINQCGNLFHGPKEPAYIHSFSITSAQMSLPREKSYLRPNLAVLGKMATAMAKLLEYSITLGYEKMLELKHEKSRCANGICSQFKYKELMDEIGKMTMSPTFSSHPKMDKMKAMTIEFFLNAREQGKSPRLMIFCHFRDMVTDIVKFLNEEKPLIVASAFVGQSNDVKGNRGMNQRTQNEVIKRFKNNEFNVLVATSIGEEGLDIGALDCIICYEAQKSPLRMLQRLGRTGRNEDGKVIVLIAEGREDKNWEKAQDQYHHVQNALLSKKTLELYDDCERLVPQGIRPVAIDKLIDVQPYISEQVEIDNANFGKTKNKPAKRKRPGTEDLPPGALLGFVTAKNYQPPKSKAETLRERIKASLLNSEETQTLEKEWRRNVKLDEIQPPIDVNHMGIHPFSTSTPMGSRLKAIAPKLQVCRNIAPSRRMAQVLKQCSSFAEDDSYYDTWNSNLGKAFDESRVIWWEPEVYGAGIRRPHVPCTENRNPIRRTWTKFLCSSLQNRPVANSDHTFVPVAEPRRTRSDISIVSSPSQLVQGISLDESHSPKLLPHLPGEIELESTTDDELPNLSDTMEVTSRTGGKRKSPTINDNKPEGSIFMNIPSSNTHPIASPEPEARFAEDFFSEGSHESSSKSTDFVPDSEGLSGEILLESDPNFAEVLFLKPKEKPSSDGQSPLIFRTQKYNKQPQHSMIGSDNGFLESAMLAPTQMPRSKRRAASMIGEGNSNARNKGKQRVMLEESEDDEAEIHSRIRTNLPEISEANDSSEAHPILKRDIKNKGKQKAKQKKHGNDWALKTGLFDLEASESDDSNISGVSESRRNGRRKRRKTKRSSSPDISSENSIDRAFIAHTSSSNMNGTSPDKSMTSFYKASIMSQHPMVAGKFKDKPNLYNGRFKWKEPSSNNRNYRYQDTPRKSDPDDHWSYDSFCVPDEETIEYEEGAEDTSEI
ncbi:hypothetical protein BY996DRAFT_4579160 [Phakopsora pachyrhizi]|uniref:ATP-dependent DNA helicase n=1 Tax=Phakopsora pachyrhizi TaxID=170000 RepID=A0AAV0AVD8_PHAPC|nr:hypothetical protein BY996DRAFT_4589041 [Phakopsora pachyrhizi]KAI8456770.1 hypothetical protein BY996DRAFT_4579160 [Phakopsora pachyrhizi]CAH7673641.1 hypothetical protein PPACK8108_LOCUS8524 [Phakopsora pachyrhizi]